MSAQEIHRTRSGMKDGPATCDLKGIGNSKVRFPIPLYISSYLCP